MLILIGGGSCAGKSTFASHLERAVIEKGSTCLKLSTDLFYKELPYGTSLKKHNFDDLTNVDLPLMEGVVKEVQESKVAFNAFDFQSHSRTLKREEGPVEVVILEGIMAFSSQSLFQNAALTVFIDTPEKLRYQRRYQFYSRVLGHSPEFIRYKFYDQAEPFYQNHIDCFKGKVDKILSGVEEWEDESIKNLLQRLLR